MTYKKFVIIVLVTLTSSLGYGWGKRGHEIVGSTAAQLLADKEKQANFLKKHSFDMGFYNNIPDLHWRGVAGKEEGYEHYIDFEIFDKVVKNKKDWSSNRKVFFKKYKIGDKAGRAPWRIHELNEKLTEVTKKLKNKKLTRQERQKLQTEWLTIAGTMGHYVADLANPMHTSENYDGQLTNQKGLHSWFESESVDELFPNLQNEVLQRAQKKWNQFHKEKNKLNAFELSLDLARESFKNLDVILKIDKNIGRSRIDRVAPKYKELILQRHTLGVLYLSEIWSRQIGWQYNGKKFYDFNLKPDYIKPNK